MELTLTERSKTNPLRIAREAGGYESTEVLAGEAGLPRSTIWRAEEGAGVPTRPIARQIIAVLHPEANRDEVNRLADELRSSLIAWQAENRPEMVKPSHKKGKQETEGSGDE